MKKIAILAALAMAATTSFGAINIMWNGAAFQSGADASKFATQDGVKLVWDLVYTSASEITAPTLDTTSGAINYASTDTILSERVWEKGSTDMKVTDNPLVPNATPSTTPLTLNTNYAMVASGSTAYKNLDYTQSSGGIYAAIFQYMEDGTVYSALTALNSSINWANEMSAADNVNFDMRSPTRIANNLGQITQVPEPATMSLLGLGALAMVIRRKLRK